MNQLDQPLLLGHEKEDEGVDIVHSLDNMIEYRRIILGIALLVSMLGGLYALLATPIYETNILLHVEDGQQSKNFQNVFPNVPEKKASAQTEIEIIRSNSILSEAVEATGVDLKVTPKYFPVIGQWVSRNAPDIFQPGVLGYGGYVWGEDSVRLSTFNVPEALQGKEFVLTAQGDGHYRLAYKKANFVIQGRVGETVRTEINGEPLEIQVDRLNASDKAQFIVERAPVLAVVKQLQKDLIVAEKGRDSNIITVGLQGTDPALITNLLNEISRQYTRQNIDRKVEEAQQSLAFLNKQLPELKEQINRSESEYNQLRNLHGTVDLAEEAKNTLQQSATARRKLEDLKQKKEELLVRLTPNHPDVMAVNAQIKSVNAELTAVESKLKRLPKIEQEVMRHAREVKVNTEVYTSLLNTAQNLRLAQENRMGAVRVLDLAAKPLEPVKPNRPKVILLAVILGLALGVAVAFIKRKLSTGIEDPSDIEDRLKMVVTAAIPHSAIQEKLTQRLPNQPNQVSVLATAAPAENAIDSLRSLRTSLQFDLVKTQNKIIMITGPTPGVGKSFVATNLATVLASNGKRVLLIDADLRKGYLHRHFGLERSGGLSELLTGAAEPDKVIHRNVVEGLDFISTGQLPRIPAELLGDASFPEFLQQASTYYDFIVIDTSPVLVVSDATIVSSHVGAVFNVIRRKVTTLGEVEESVKRLLKARSPYKGLIFNDLVPRSSKYRLLSGKYRYAEYEY